MIRIKNELIIHEKWKPKKCENYYYADIISQLFCSVSTWRNDEIDNRRYNIGIVRKTFEEAEVVGKEIYYEEIFKNLSDITDKDWSDISLKKWYLYWDYIDNTIKCNFIYTEKFCNVFFKSVESIQNAINNIGENNIVKYILKINILT